MNIEVALCYFYVNIKKVIMIIKIIIIIIIIIIITIIIITVTIIMIIIIIIKTTLCPGNTSSNTWRQKRKSKTSKSKVY